MKKIRVLIAKPGLDGHDRGALVIAQALRDHGMEVIYTGLRQSPQQIAQAAIQEDVDVIGLSSLSGAHRTLFPKVVQELEQRNAGDIPVIGGGVIPSEDIPYLLEQGIKKIFTSGSTTDALASFIKELMQVNGHVVSKPKKIAHIGIAVQNIEQALSFYTDMLHLDLEHVEHVESEGVKVAFLRIGETRIELLEPLHEDSSIKRFLEKQGEGIHHIAIDVDNIEARMTQMKTNGVKFSNDAPTQGAHDTKVAFIHPKSAHGVLIELCEQMKGSE
ncbi:MULTISPECIES: methylmalonyl-CoA epimerase [unclassified Virgibacillus]|uniref:methylmalonyl-CoA epimerase n=1 Tax=unclassified Virgibacillus TaxID=2620237 RepID=UPI0024DED2A6|nr:methylmalonyl-CoA epimerase [Virgibacillus sp. LDC-1]